MGGGMCATHALVVFQSMKFPTSLASMYTQARTLHEHVQVPFGGCVRRAGARAGAADRHLHMLVECPGLCVVRAMLHVQ
eukprot:7388082-Prymnesium_polylepis.3